MKYLRSGLLPAIVVCACGSQGEPVREVGRLDAEERASYEAALEHLQGELDAALIGKARAEEATLDAQLGIDASDGGRTARLEHELEACQQELLRYRAGLERAVEELNRPRSPRPVETRPFGQTAATDHGRVHVFTPRVQIHMLGVLVEWRLYSTRDSTMEATAVIRLLEDGQEVEVERQPVTVGAHASHESSVIFHLTPNPTGSYTAQVTLEDRY